jgi:hypothetical protein
LPRKCSGTFSGEVFHMDVECALGCIAVAGLNGAVQSEMLRGDNMAVVRLQEAIRLRSDKMYGSHRQFQKPVPRRARN